MSNPGKEPTPANSSSDSKDTAASTFPAMLGMAVCLVLAALFLIKPVRRYLDARQAIQVLAEVKQSTEAYRYDAAYVGLRKALELAPDRLEVVQVAADVLTRREDPTALAFWKSLIQAGKATQADRTRYVELAMKLGRVDLASPALAELRKENPSSAELKILEIRLKVQMEESAGAAALAEEWLTKSPELEAAQFAGGWVRLRQSDPNSRAEGRRLLLAVASGQSEWRTQAVQALAIDPELNRAELQIVARILDSLKDPSPEQQMRLADLRLRIDASKQSEIIGALVESSKTFDTYYLMPLANWMELHNALKAVPQILPLERVRTNAPLLMIRLQTLAWLGETTEVEEQLGDATSPLDALQRHIIRSTLATRKTPREDPLPSLENALKLAGTNGVMIANIATHALRLQLTNAAIDIYSQLIPQPAHASAAITEILRLLDESAPTRATRDRLRALSNQLPGSTLLLMEACYFDLLLKENIAQARSHLDGLASKNSESFRIRLCLALADLIEKKPQTALARLGNDSMAWSRAAPRWQAIHAAILGENGKIEPARAAVKSIDRSRLRPEELAWIAPWQ